MPFTLKLTTSSGDTIESPFIVPDNPSSKIGMEDKKIQKSIIRTGKEIVSRSTDIVKFECVHY